MGRTPPHQRHHLPFSASKSPSYSTAFGNGNVALSRCGGKRFNQIFLCTCVASFVLQLFGSIASWNHPHLLALGPHSRERRVQADASGASRVMAASSTAYGAPPHQGRLRILVGILTADFSNDESYRKRHRQLFKLWNDKRVCSLPDFKSRPLDRRYECQVIYTFVIGANPDASPELVDDSRPMEVDKPIRGKCSDLNEPDMTLLNIRENMNEGKSQTWMKYGADIAEEYDLDYVTKCDADTLFHLHEFFQWAYVHLPPAPYNKHVYVGALRDKAYWPRHDKEEDRIRYESFFGNNYEGVHLYVAGQIYIMSTDLARFVGKEAFDQQMHVLRRSRGP